MRTNYLLLTGTILMIAFAASAQQPGSYAFIAQNGRGQAPAVGVLNGSDTLSTIYSNTQCGLNYAYDYERLGQRFIPVGVAQPASLVIGGIPACAVIDHAYLWTELLGPSAIPITATLQNPVGATASYSMTPVGSSIDVCWGLTGTHVYRADVTASIVSNGSGTYLLSGLPVSPPNSGMPDVEGASLLIIYHDPAATYTGTLIIDDGCETVPGGTLSHTMTNINACANSTAGNVFMMLGDIQMGGYTISMNNQPVTQPQWNWWNVIDAPTSVTAGQNTCSYQLDGGGDCYTLAVAGLYFQTACQSCTPVFSPLALTCNVQPDNCNGNGSATVSVTGGTAPYTITWYASPVQTGASATGLAAGTYYVEVIDAQGNCGGQQVVVPYTGMLLTTSSTLSSCQQPTGTASVSVTGGSAPYSFLWNTVPAQTTATATGLSPGLYTVTVTDASGCVMTAADSVHQNSAISAYGYCSASSCSGYGNATIVASGGQAPYTYLWNSVPAQTTPTATGLAFGTYQVTVTDALGCTVTDSVQVTPPPPIGASAAQLPTPCNVTPMAVAYAFGTPPYTYVWNTVPAQTGDTATLAAGGTYSVIITDSQGCVDSATITIPNTPFQLAVPYPSQYAYCASGVTLSANSSDTTAVFTWQPGNLSGNPVTAFPVASTTYTVTATASCGTMSDTVLVYMVSYNPYSEPICYVTVDTSNNKYKVVWERSMPVNGGTYNVYKEIPFNSNNYVLLSAQPVSLFTSFTDMSSDASVMAERYAMSTTDSCGNISPVSQPHRGIFLSVTPGQPGGWDLVWLAYQGAVAAGYTIYRGATLNTMTVLTTVSGSTLTYSDPNPPQGPLFYMVEMQNNFPCTPSIAQPNTLSPLSADNMSRSNIISTATIGMTESGTAVSFNIVPNPNNGSFTVMAEMLRHDKAVISVLDALGREVYSETETAVNGRLSSRINLESLASGMYTLRLQSGTAQCMRKLVISK